MRAPSPIVRAVPVHPRGGFNPWPWVVGGGVVLWWGAKLLSPVCGTVRSCLRLRTLISQGGRAVFSDSQSVWTTARGSDGWRSLFFGLAIRGARAHLTPMGYPILGDPAVETIARSTVDALAGRHGAELVPVEDLAHAFNRMMVNARDAQTLALYRFGVAVFGLTPPTRTSTDMAGRLPHRPNYSERHNRCCSTCSGVSRRDRI